ncbi:MAG: FAD-binding oxidoreductase [Armatimonadota bacterium]|nr:FAD-binding oxidoreductase [Armatimonadota bacterium]
MNLLERLQNEFGDAVAVRAASETDAVDEMTPQAIAAPRDEEAARALLAWCGREKVALVARGGGTKLSLGARPERCDLMISTENLNRVIEHDDGNATVAAEAGISLSTLNELVGQCDQFVPLDGAEPGSRETLGGAIATNHSGMSRLKYGTPRDLVVGLHAVLSDGRLVKAGSKVVKNVSGYDLNKIFIGSFGTLGLITQVTLRLRPKDAASQTWQASFASWEAAAQSARAILEGAFEPTALRVWTNGQSFRLLARFDGSETAVRVQLERLPRAEMVDENDRDGQQPEGQLRLRAGLPLQRAVGWAQLAQESGAGQITWDCGLGIVRAAFESMPEHVSSSVAKLRAEAEGSGGYVVVEDAPAALKTLDFVWGAPRSDFALMRSLKQAYDAAGVCAPGRFVGGL